jgi:hypothetical protein
MARNRSVPTPGSAGDEVPLGRRLARRLAVLPFLIGFLLAPAFLTGAWPADLTLPTYVGLVAATVLVGWLAPPRGQPSVGLVALGGLAVALAWGLPRARTPKVGVDGLLVAWRGMGSAAGLGQVWPLALIAPAGLLVVVQALRGEGELPAIRGERGFLEGLPGRAGLFGLSVLGFGVAGTLFAGSTFLEKVAVVAPIFEEYAKLGLALLVLTALGLSSGASAYALGALSGIAFGLVEHHVTYSTEAQAMFVVRVLFHGLAAALSALIYVHLRRREDLAPGAAWFAIAPAALVHAANNVSAIVVSLARAMRAMPPLPISEALGAIFIATLIGMALITGFRPQRTVAVIEEAWHRINGQIDRPQILPVQR